MIGAAARTVTRLLPHRSDYAESPRSWRRDVLAGVTVGVVALPLALAFGISSGVGAAAGLITAVVAGLVAAVFGGSNVQVSGPTGAMAVVLAPIVVHYGLGSIALVTILAGLIVLAAGVTGLGRAVTFIPWPVIEGFTLGIATIIFLQQVPAAFGRSVPQGRESSRRSVGCIAPHRLDDRMHDPGDGSVGRGTDGRAAPAAPWHPGIPDRRGGRDGARGRGTPARRPHR
jgi:SulP family sulfate permease